MHSFNGLHKQCHYVRRVSCGMDTELPRLKLIAVKENAAPPNQASSPCVSDDQLRTPLWHHWLSSQIKHISLLESVPSLHVTYTMPNLNILGLRLDYLVISIMIDCYGQSIIQIPKSVKISRKLSIPTEKLSSSAATSYGFILDGTHWSQPD